MKTSIQFFNLQFLIEKKLLISLTQIFGIGFYSAIVICKKFGFNKNTYIKSVDVRIVNAMRNFILDKFVVQEQLKEQIQVSIVELDTIKSIRGFRHKLCLPVHGQRTKTNRRTQRKFKRMQSKLWEEDSTHIR
uniref:A5170672-5fdf-4477-8887-0b2da1233aa5-CDS n=1 Tax=Plasmodiophora brassicae TaxID=37360 RepID=A0A3P3YWE1_PLABS|nr:a5170672-5fdf-4477-8887-0b2da1233aa5-CDS [Plasmodiophora brassicae]